LQQVIFVIPQRDWKTIFARRKREAEAMRAKFNGCKNTRASMKGLIDVTVRDLGQVLAPELPTDWAEDVKKTKVGGVTPLHITKRGLEYIAICSGKEVSDDRVAELVLESGKNQDEMAKQLSDKYTAELRKKARIIER
jgi:peptidyl-prolyl cis-trans isomerase SurA